MQGTFSSTRIRLTLAAAAVALLLTPLSGQAAVIVFGQLEQGGTITDLGGNNYKGEDIIFESITYGTAIVYCGVHSGDTGNSTDTNCLLNFDTSDGSFVLTAESGLYDSDGILIPGGEGPLTVLEGTITDWNDNFGLGFVGIGTDSKNQALLDYFGISSNNFTFVNTVIYTGGFNREGVAQVTDADINNTIPEPGILALFGLGLLGVGRQLARRRRD